jgi:predicted component of type VI protein secretion system
MRALILVAGAALAVSACSSNDAANNTMNVDENLTAPADMNATDMNATDMNATDMNAMNAADTANAAADTANAAAATANAAANNAQ